MHVRITKHDIRMLLFGKLTKLTIMLYIDLMKEDKCKRGDLILKDVSNDVIRYVTSFENEDKQLELGGGKCIICMS